MLFDNMSVYQSTGPILEETHYYPFGLVMDGISTVAPLKLANNYKYNGKLLNHNEFSDGTGLDWYSYGFRDYDPQIGRFIEQDPLVDVYATLSPYQYAVNDPLANIDVNGLGVLPTLTVTAQAVHRVMPSISMRFISELSLSGKISLAINGAKIASTAINVWGVTKAAGDQVATLDRMKSYFLNNIMRNLYPPKIIYKMGDGSYRFTKPAAHLLSLVSGVKEKLILTVNITSRHHFGDYRPWYSIRKTGGGAITIGNGIENNITYTENYFADDPNSFHGNGFGRNAMAWLSISSHEVGHLPQIEKYESRILYLFAFAKQYIESGSHGGAPYEKEANKGEITFFNFNDFTSLGNTEPFCLCFPGWGSMPHSGKSSSV